MYIILLCINTEELDYVAFNETVYVPIGSSNGSLVCVNITIVDDSSFEKENYFLVNVGDVENNVFIEDRQSLIHVIDNDGNQFCSILAVTTLRAGIAMLG